MDAHLKFFFAFIIFVSFLNSNAHSYGNYLFSGGDIAACLKTSDGRFVNYGTKFSQFQITPKKNINFLIDGGEKCGNGNYYLNVTLVGHSVGLSPQIVSKSECFFNIEWLTPHMLPVFYTKAKDPSGCILNVQSHRDTITIDLRPHFEEKDYRVDSLDGTYFRINFCEGLKQSCAQKKDVKVCWVNNQGEEIAIGLTGSGPILKDYGLSFNFEGMPCDNSNKISVVHFVMNCSYSEKMENPYFIKKEGCFFNIFWKTKMACYLNSEEKNCTVKKNGTFLDLSSLIQLDRNYHVSINKTHEFVLNICHSLIPGLKIGCSEYSHGCLIDNTSLDKRPIFQNYFFNNLNKSSTTKLTLVDPYEFQLSGEKKVEIDFECGPDNEHVDYPHFVRYENNLYLFKWRTSIACHKSKPSSISAGCRVLHPYSNITFDLTPLMKLNPINLNNDTYLSICQPLNLAMCHKNSGICKKTVPLNYGNYSNQLVVLENSLSLNYSSPDSNFFTLIYFVCPIEGAPNVKMLQISNHLTIVYFGTPIACFNKKICTLHKPLLSLNHVYEVTVPNGTVSLRICTQLDPHKDPPCPGGSSGCFSSTKSQHKSIGYPLVEPIVLKDQSVLIVYPKGDFCNEKLGLRYSTYLRFICNPYSGIGYPKFIEITESCHYKFEWITSLICNKSFVKPTCQPSKMPSFLKRLPPGNLIVNDTYFINMCRGSANKCISDICVKINGYWNSLGNLYYHSFLSYENSVVLKYLPSTDTSCFGELRIYCNRTSHTPPKVTWAKPNCGLQVEWQSPLVCSEENITKTGFAWKTCLLFLITSVVLAVFYVLSKRLLKCKNLANRDLNEIELLQPTDSCLYHTNNAFPNENNNGRWKLD